MFPACSLTRACRTGCAAALLGLVVLGTVGCGRKAGYERFVPSDEACRRALDAALAAWQGGRPTQRIDSVVPAVQFVDAQRRPGQKLTTYEVLGQVPAEAPRCYAVRLTLTNPAEEVKARYVVVGDDPVWVFRLEDYVMVTHWDHTMDGGAAKTKDASR